MTSNSHCPGPTLCDFATAGLGFCPPLVTEDFFAAIDVAGLDLAALDVAALAAAGFFFAPPVPFAVLTAVFLALVFGTGFLIPAAASFELSSFSVNSNAGFGTARSCGGNR